MFSEVRSETQRTGYTSGRMLTRTETDRQCLTPELFTDYPGNGFTRALTATQAECCDLCNKIDPCAAYTWTKFHGGTCFLKTGALTAISATGVVTALV